MNRGDWTIWLPHYSRQEGCELDIAWIRCRRSRHQRPLQLRLLGAGAPRTLTSVGAAPQWEPLVQQARRRLRIQNARQRSRSGALALFRDWTLADTRRAMTLLCQVPWGRPSACGGLQPSFFECRRSPREAD